MGKTLCYSVRVAEIKDISAKAVKINCFDGSSDIFPKSAIFGSDYGVSKSDAIWIAAWLLEKKSIQYSKKKSAWFDEHGKQLPSYKITKHSAEKVKPVSNNTIDELIK